MQSQRGAELPECALLWTMLGAVRDHKSLTGLAQTIVEHVRSAIPSADGAALFVSRSPSDSWEVLAASGYTTSTVLAIRLSPEEVPLNWAPTTGRVILHGEDSAIQHAVAAFSKDNQRRFSGIWEDSGRPVALLFFPLGASSVISAMLMLESRSADRKLGAGDVDILSACAPLMSLALERVYLADQVENHREQGRRAHELQQQIMAALSHDMRTPLASVQGYASALLLDGVTWSPETTTEYLEIIVDESMKLDEIISDLLDASRIDAGRLDIVKEPVRLPSLVQEVIDDIGRRSDKHRFLMVFPPEFPLVEVDAGRIRRVLHNLLDNAVKYSPQGGLVVVRGDPGPERVTVSVADEGQGIAPEHLNRLFEPFFRVQDTVNRHVVGSGLGLPIARSIVEAHGGHIWATSTYGQGTTVYFELPRMEDPDEAKGV